MTPLDDTTRAQLEDHARQLVIDLATHAGDTQRVEDRLIGEGDLSGEDLLTTALLALRLTFAECMTRTDQNHNPATLPTITTKENS